MVAVRCSLRRSKSEAAVKRVGMLSVGLGALLMARGAAAQGIGTQGSVDVQTFWPAAGPTDHLALRGSVLQPSGDIGFGLTFNLMSRPLTLTPVGATQASPAVDYALTSDFLFAIGFAQRFQISAAVPVVLAQAGEGTVPVLGARGARLPDTAIRDLRVEVSWAIVQRARRRDARGIGLRLDLGAAIPLGDDKGFQGSGGFTFAPMLGFDWRLPAITLTANAGARVRDTSRIGDLAVGSVGVAGAGVAIRPLFRTEVPLTFVFDYLATFSFGTESGFNSANTQELYYGVRYATDAARDIELFAGGAMPLGSGALMPAWRAMAGVSYAPRGIDTDGDGVVDASDRCRTEPEDRDDFEDEDGCADRDNDQDGVPDATDRCPNDPEDADNFQDEDGCADADNDGDTVDDVDDECPSTASGDHPDEARRGCPIPDTDRDGVLDPDDRCVDIAQGPRPDPTRGGCPLPDRDGDGVADAADQCPDDAQGATADRWRPGCADNDPDRDGVVGEADRCADQPETINGVTDDDGCPDVGAEVVTWLDDGVTLRFAAPFVVAPRAQVLTPAQVTVVRQLAQRIRARGGEVTRVIVEVAPGPGIPGQTEAGRQAEVVGDALIGQRIPARSISARAQARVVPAPRVVVPRAGQLTVRIERREAPAVPATPAAPSTPAAPVTPAAPAAPAAASP